MSEEGGDEDGINFEVFEERLINKINNYFSSNNNELLSYENLDDFLKEIELDEFCSSEDDKDNIWKSFMKYGKDNKIDAEGTRKGMHDFIIFLQNGNEENNDDNNDENSKEIKENKDEYTLTRLSRLVSINDNKLVLNKYKQRALEEYDCLDNQTLIQLKRIFLLLNINENSKNIIPVERIEQLINKHKFITLDKNEVIKYIHYLSCDNKPLEEITTININNTIFSEIDAILQDKLINEDIDPYEINEEEEEEEEHEEDLLDILNELLQKIEETRDNSLALKEMKNDLAKRSQTYTETVNKFLQDNLEENQIENLSVIEEMGIVTFEKSEKFDEYITDLTKDQKTSIKKIHFLKKSIMNINKKMNQLKDDYKDIYERYNNNQEVDLDEEMQRLCDENLTLDQELKSKKEEISELINERAEKDNQINDLYIKLEEVQKNEKDLKKQVYDLKIAVAKSKEEYDNLMDNVLNKIEKKENEEKMERNRIKEMIEKQLENEEDKKDNEKLDIKALNDIDNMKISLTDKLMKKKKILSQLKSEQLMEYVLKLERLNINLKSEKNKKDKKIKELEEKLNQSNKTISSNKKEIGSLNIEVKKLKNTISKLQNEVKSNEVFRPSITMNSQMRISRMSKLNTVGINALKFKQLKIENKIKNSNDYFKNMTFNISGKKQIKTMKLKDQIINQKSAKNQNTNLTLQNTISTFYEKDNKNAEEQTVQNPQKNITDNNDNTENQGELNNKNNSEISKNEENHNEEQKNDFNNLAQNGIEFNIQPDVNIVNGEGGEIVIDNINDINLGGSSKELFEIKEEENINENDEKKDNNKPISSFFESKPQENDFGIYDEKNEDIQTGERETIQVKNNQMAIGGLEDMLFGQMDDNNEEEEDNLGRISEHNSEIKNENQMSKFGLDIGGKRKISSHDNNIKSSGDIFDNKISKNIVEEVANIIEDNFEINKGNQININNEEQKKDDLKINSNKIQISKTAKEADLQISINNININSNPKEEKKEDFEIAKSNIIEINDDKNNQNISPNINTLEISTQNNTLINTDSNPKSQIIIQQVSNTNRESKRTASRIRREIEKNNYDYYSLFHEEYVLNKLHQLNDKANEKNIYSDQIYVLTNGKKLEKRLILLTPSHIFIIEPKEAQFVLIMEKTELEKIAISNQNLNILILLRYKAENVILLTLRRMDLLNFIKKYYHQSQKPIRFTYEDNFKIRIKGKEMQLSVKDKIFTTLSNFDGAIKIGYLQKMNPLFFKTFSERLVVLTSIGLIVFNDPTKPPERLYPIIGSKINKALGTKYKRPNCFEILTPNGETKVFSAYKERELNSWLEEFEKVKKDFRNKMKKLDTVNKLEFIDSNNLFDVEEEEGEDEILPNNK